LNILVIDDDPGVRGYLAEVLRRAGHEVSHAQDGPGGIARFESKPADIVITDVKMPGMDGVDVLRKIKEIDAEAEVIMITAFEDSDAIIRSLQNGASDFLKKPFDPDTLLDALNKPMERRRLKVQNRVLQESIARAQTLNEHIANSVPSALLVLSGDLRVDWANQRVEEMFNRPAQKTHGLFICEVLGCSQPATRECPLVAELNEFVNTGRAVHGLELNLEMTGGEREFRVSIDLLRGEEKILLVLDDVTSHKQLEQALRFKEWQLEHADKLASLGEMIAGLAHEIHNPVTYIRGNIQNVKLVWSALEPMLRGWAADHPDASVGRMSLEEITAQLPELLDDAEHGTDRLARTVNRLRKFSRPDSAKEKTVLSLADVIDGALRLLESQIKEKVEVRREYDPSTPPVLGNPERLEHVFVNVVSNALAAVSDVEGPQITIRLKSDGKGLAVAEIADNGCGMSRDVLEHMFEPFYTTKPPGAGTGLGLTVAQGIVQDYGGRMLASSTPGKRTTITIKIPAAPPSEKTGGS